MGTQGEQDPENGATMGTKSVKPKERDKEGTRTPKWDKIGARTGTKVIWDKNPNKVGTRTRKWDKNPKV